MDNFMSKLSQRINAQDTIKANLMADAAEKEQLKKQLAEYDSIMQSVRNLYLKQEENSEVFKELLAKLDAKTATEDKQPQLLAEMKEYISKSDEFTHKECVKVYRNVQALLDEQNKKLDADVAALKEQVESCKAPDLSEELAQLKRMEAKHNRTNKWLLWLAVLMSAANIAVVLCIYFGILPF
ncbi:MAG: hypothetical protein IJZ84_05035 [Lachnospiraceae bacterium]|nr:hypothetical protein [Lachnospiraceae bacterium]